MLGVLPFVEDPDLSVSAARALAQHLPPWCVQAGGQQALYWAIQPSGSPDTDLGGGKVHHTHGHQEAKPFVNLKNVLHLQVFVIC